MPFRALQLSSPILKAIQEAGYTEPTPIQLAAVPEVLAGRDVIGIAQTGTGKTAAFVWPILTRLTAARTEGKRRGLRALVVAPTRELVVQIDENVRAYARHLPVRMVTIFGGVSERPQIEALRSGVDLVVATPGRLIDLMGQRQTNFSGIEFLVLVFTRTKHGADRIARRLESSGIKTGTIHSNRSQNQRLRALKDFKSGAVRVLVATDIAARGIDVDGISHVVNYDFPMHSEDYVHRIGRTGRAHAIGDAISFITPEDQGSLRSLERFIGRGIVRKKAEGFDYNQAAPPGDERGRGARVRQRKIEPRLPGNSPRGSGDAPHGQVGWRFRNASSNNRPPRRSYRRHR